VAGPRLRSRRRRGFALIVSAGVAFSFGVFLHRAADLLRFVLDRLIAPFGIILDRPFHDCSIRFVVVPLLFRVILASFDVFVPLVLLLVDVHLLGVVLTDVVVLLDVILLDVVLLLFLLFVLLDPEQVPEFDAVVSFTRIR
jgi:hypothetical protein